MKEGQDAANLEAMTAAVAYQASMADLVARKLDFARLGEGATVLDFGSGRGDYAALLRSRTGVVVTGMEPDKNLHEHYPPDVPVLATLDQLPSELGAAYTLNVLEHIDDDEAALRALAARCAPGAHIFILVPANPALWTSMDTLVGHRRRYTPVTLRACAQAAGLAVVEQGWFDRTGYAATRAFQLLSRLRKESTPGAVSKGQVKLFDLLFSVAEPFLAALRLPFGKNCWVLVKKPTPQG